MLCLLVGCGAEPTPTPDAVATQIAVEEAAHATMTAQAPTPTPTLAPTPTVTPTPIPSPTPTPKPKPSLNADISLEQCRLTLEDLPQGFRVAESEAYDEREPKPEGSGDLDSQVTGSPVLLITINRVHFTDGETHIVQTLATFQGPNQAHDVAMDAQEYWSVWGMAEPFDLPNGTLGDETFAYYERLTSAEGGWICSVGVRYGAGISWLTLGMDSSLSQDQFIGQCEDLLRKIDLRIEQCSLTK